MRSTLRFGRRLALLLFAAATLPGATNTAPAALSESTQPPSVARAGAVAGAAAMDPSPIQVEPVLSAATEPAAPVASPPVAPAVDTAVATRRLVLDESQVVAIYGHPGVPIMGILGAYDADGAAQAAARLAGQWDEANGPGRGSVGALHLITYVAQPYPMADGSYLTRMAEEGIQEYVDAARRHGLLLILDVQVGMADPLAEAQRLAPFLREPFVHFALDPEFAMRARGGVPGQRMGSLDAAEVNAVQGYLSELVAAHALPPKMLILHQFREDMLTNTAQFRDFTGVERVIDMDGWGGDETKLAHYETFALAPYAQRPAIKLFYEWDAPMLTPQRLLELAEVPQLVIYQ